MNNVKSICLLRAKDYGCFYDKMFTIGGVYPDRADCIIKELLILGENSFGVLSEPYEGKEYLKTFSNVVYWSESVCNV